MFDFVSSFPPALVMILGAFTLPFLPVQLRRAVVLLLPLLTLVLIWMVPVEGEGLAVMIAGFEVNPLYVHPFTRIFATVFAIAAFAGALFGLLQSRMAEMMAACIYAGSAIGVTFCGDYISLFIYWELMAIGSTLVIFASDMPGSRSAGMRYALVHFLGGVVLMSGIVAHLVLSGDASLVAFHPKLTILFPDYELDMHTVAVWMILVGVLINAAAPPLSSWLPDAYPKGSPSGAVYLSAFTTKTAVFVLLLLFPGVELLMYVGMFMIFYGIIYAILENDMRKILAYSVINQVGFMVTGVGIGTELAQQGVALHAFCHIIYKALLFMSAGSVLYMTGKSKCSELGGLYHSMRLTTLCGTVGALAISAFPFTSGFVSKSLISSAALHEHMAWVWFGLVAASAGVFLHAGIKFPWFVFFQKDSGMRPKDPPLNMRLAMIFFALLCLVPAIPGVTEVTLYKLVPAAVNYEAYTPEHVVSQLQLLLFSGLAFFVMLSWLKRTETISLDFDWIYRSFARYIILFSALLARLPLRLLRLYARKGARWGKAFLAFTHGPGGAMARSWSIGTTATWTILLLGVYLVVYYP